VYDPVLSARYTAGFTLNIVQEVNSPTTMLSLVAGGVAERTKPSGVVLKDVADLRVTTQFSAIWRKDNRAPAVGPELLFRLLLSP